MSTLIESLHTDIAGKGGSLVWSANLTYALGNPAEWEYTGEVSQGQMGKTFCACGHPIVDCFHIRNPRTHEQKIIGSTCIGYFEQAGEIYANLSAALKCLEEKMREAKKAAKRAADEIKVSEARAAFEALYDGHLARFRGYRERGQMAPRELWWTMASHYRVHRTAPEYQRPCDYLKWYAKQTKALANL